MKTTGEERTGDVAPTPSFHVPVVGKILTWILVIAMMVHTVMVGLWVAPSTPLRDTVGQERVREYINPWFEQNWSIFAPNPRRVAVTFEVRAMVRTAEGAEEPTEWIDLIDNDDSIVAGNPFPPRTAKISRRTTDRLHSTYSKMNEGQREWINADYVETPIDRLRDRLNEADSGASPGQIEAYLTAESTATLIASAFANHQWGDDGEIVYVQFRTSTRPAPRFDEDGSTIDDTERTERHYGWRSIAEIDAEALEHFNEYFEQGGDWQ